VTEPVAVGEANEPARPRAVTLLLDPAAFFAAGVPRLTIGAKLAIIAVMGLSGGADRTAQIMGNGPLSSDWAMFWGAALGAGVLLGPLNWFLGGALFRLRVRFAGARGCDDREAQGIYALCELVSDVSLLAWTLVATAAFAAPLELPISFTVMIAIGWRLFVGYQGVRARFPVSPWKARLWFIILPGLLYVAVLVKVRWF
jgi:hypothetical protein